MNDDERATLAALVTSERVRQYGTRSGAYRAAGLNPTTWQRIEDGEPVRPDRLAAAVRTLWPESGGDWRRVSASTDRPLADYEDRAILGEIEARLDERKVEGRGHRAAATTRAGESPAPELHLSDVADRIVNRFRVYAEQADEARKTRNPAESAAWLARLRSDFERFVVAELAQERPNQDRNVG